MEKSEQKVDIFQKFRRDWKKDAEEYLKKAKGAKTATEFNSYINEAVTRASGISEENERNEILRKIAAEYIKREMFDGGLVAILLIKNEEEKDKALKELVKECLRRGREDKKTFLDWINFAWKVAEFLSNEEKMDAFVEISEDLFVEISKMRDKFLSEYSAKHDFKNHNRNAVV
jgi:hypothetical protein